MGYRVVGTQKVTYKVNSKEEQERAKGLAQKKTVPAAAKPDALTAALLSSAGRTAPRAYGDGSDAAPARSYGDGSDPSLFPAPDPLAAALLQSVRKKAQPPARTRLDVPSGWERVGGVLTGAAKSTGAGYTNLGGAAIEGMGHLNTWIADKQDRAKINQLLEDNERYRQMLASGRKLDGTALTERERASFQQSIARNERLMGLIPTYTQAQEARTLETAGQFYDKADELVESAAQDVAEAKRGAGELGQFAVDLGVAGTQLAGDMAMGGLPAMFARSVGSGAQEARHSGAGYGQQLAYGLGSGALSVVTEKIFNVAGPFRKVFGKGVLDDAIAKATGRLGQTAAGRMALSALGEGAEEFVEAVFQPVLQRATFDPEARFNLEQALYDAAIGAALGGLGGGVEVAGNAMSRRNGTQGTAAPQAANREGTITPPAQAGAQSVTEAEKAAPMTGAAVNENGLAALTEQEKINLSSGKKNKIVSTFREAVAFVKNALSNKQSVDRAYLGKVPETVVQAVSQSAGLDIRGFGVMMNGNDVRHIIKDHGDALLEAARGQVAVTPEDIARVPEILSSPDRVYLSDEADARGRRALVFEKQIGDKYITIQGISDGKKVLQADTLYIRKGRTRTTRDTMPGTQEGAVPVINAQGEPPQSSSFTDFTISQEADFVNPGDGLGAADAGFDPFTAAQAEYGTLPSGENPVRSDDVPASVSGFDKVSQSVVTAKGAAVTLEEFVPLLENETVKGGFSFIPITNSDTVQEAMDTISYKGWESALADWTSDVRRRRAGEDITATGALLYNNAVNAGDYRLALDILTDYQTALRSMARGVQAARILKTLTPDSRLYMMRRSVQRMAEDLHLSEDVSIDQELELKYLNAEDDAARDKAVEAIQQNIADQLPATLLDKWTALRYVNMLGNFKIQGRNILGNAGMQAVRAVKDGIAAGLEAIAHQASGGKIERTKAMTVSDELMKAARADYKNVEDVALGEGKYQEGLSGDAFARGVQDRRTIFKNNGVWGTKENSPGIAKAARWATDKLWTVPEGYRTLTNWAMEQGDVVFTRHTYARALAGYLKANGVTAAQFSDAAWQGKNAAFLDKARQYAVREAQEATFRDTNALSGWISKVGRRRDTPKAVRVAAEGLAPFRKTPANVLVRAEEYSPLGVINTVAAAVRAKQGKATGADVINSLSKTLTGTGIFLAGMLLRGAGLLRGGDDEDEKQRGFDDLTGRQPYSLELPGGLSITLDWLTPEAMPLFMGAQLEDMRQQGDIALKDLERSLTSLAEPMLQMSMMQGVSDTLGSLKYSEDNLGQLAVSLALDYLTQGLTNSLVGQLERTSETERQSTYTDRNSPIPPWLQRELGWASAKVPGWDYQQIPYIDAWGREEESGDLLTRILVNSVSPAYISQVEVDQVEAELQRIADATGDTGVFPARAGRYFTVNGERKDLTAEEYVKYAKALGKGRYELARQAMASDAYAALDDAGKAAFISKMYQVANAKAMKRTVSSYSYDDEMRRYMEAEREGITPVEFYAYKEATGGLRADKDEHGNSVSGSKKEKVVAAIARMDLSPTEKDWLYLLNGYAEKDLPEMPWR